MPDGQDAFLSPEGILMMLVALILDLAGLMMLILSFVGIGIIFSFVLDFIGIVFIGGGIFIRTGRIRLTGRAFKRLGLGILGEIIPIVGDVLPLWTWIVYKELKEPPPEKKGTIKTLRKLLKKRKELKERELEEAA